MVILSIVIDIVEIVVLSLLIDKNIVLVFIGEGIAAIRPQIDHGILIVLRQPSRHMEIGIGNLQGASTQSVFLSAGKIRSDSQNPFAEAISCLAGAIEIAVFHHQALAISYPVMPQIGFELGIVQQGHFIVLITGIELGIGNDLVHIFLFQVGFTFGAVVHPTDLVAVAIACPQLDQDVRIDPVQIEIAPISQVFAMIDAHVGAIIVQQERLQIHIHRTFVKIAGVILHLSIPHQAVLHRGFLVVNITAEIGVAIVRQPHSVPQVAGVGDRIPLGHAAQNPHGIHAGYIGKADQIVKCILFTLWGVIR